MTETSNVACYSIDYIYGERGGGLLGSALNKKDAADFIPAGRDSGGVRSTAKNTSMENSGKIYRKKKHVGPGPKGYIFWERNASLPVVCRSRGTKDVNIRTFIFRHALQPASYLTPLLGKGDPETGPFRKRVKSGRSP